MKIELHAHTAHSSACGRVEAAQGLAMYRDAGYDAVVITDHYNTHNLDRFPGAPLEQTRAWLGGYQQAKTAGETLGLRVLFGLEARLPGSENDYLIFGAEPEFVLENPQLHELDLPGLHALCRRYGALLVQAHPNRSTCTPAPHEHLDGVEVFNGNPRHDSHNDLTLSQAKRTPRLILTSGSDFHRPEDLARGGIVTDRDVRTSRDLADCLTSGDYTLIRTEE